MMKGAGFLLTVIVVSIIIFALAVVLITDAFANASKKERIVLQSLEIIKASNTFHLVNKTLHYTWYTSTIQSIFRSLDDSLGCGLENDRIDDRYWLQTDPSRARTDDYDKIVNLQLLPAPDGKYNSPNDNPRICTPKMSHLQLYMQSKMEPFLEIIRTFKINDNNVVISDNIPSSFDLPNPNVASITSMESEEIAVFDGSNCPSSNTCVNATGRHVIDISTEAARIVFVAREITESLLIFSNQFIPVLTRGGFDEQNPVYLHNLKYQDTCSDDILGIPTTQNRNVYSSAIRNILQTTINLRQNELQKSRIFTTFNKFEFLVPSDIDNTNGVMESGTGLLLHYDASVRITEVSPGPVVQCTTPSDEYRSYVESAVPDRWAFFLVSYEREEIIPVILSMINAESSWYQYAVSDCGAAGLMQLMPGTARANGISPIFQNADFTDCNEEYARDLRQELLSRVDPVTYDGRFDPQRNIFAGVNHFRSLLTYYSASGDKNAALILAIAAYNAGRGAVDEATSNAGSIEWDKVRLYLPIETQNYVSKVLGCNLPYGGSFTVQPGASTITWPTRSTRITSCFGPRPSPYEPSETDFHGGIDVGPVTRGQIGDPVFAALDGFVDVSRTCSGVSGECIRIRHDIGDSTFYTWYFHLGRRDVSEGTTVSAGEKIGEMGSTGISSTHLHFEIRDSDNRADTDSINPCLYLDCSNVDRGVSNPAGCRDVDPVAGKDGELPNLEAATTVRPDMYYYHDEDENQFVQRPISMTSRAEDYLPVIDCVKIPNVYRNRPGRLEDYLFYYWDDDDKPDIICYRGCLYTCNLDLPGTDGACPYPNRGDRTLVTDESPELVSEPRYKCGDDASKLFLVNLCTG